MALGQDNLSAASFRDRDLIAVMITLLSLPFGCNGPMRCVVGTGNGIQPFRHVGRQHKRLETRMPWIRLNASQPPVKPLGHRSKHWMAVGKGVIALLPGLPNGGCPLVDHVTPARIGGTVDDIVDFLGRTIARKRFQDIFSTENTGNEMSGRRFRHCLTQGVDSRWHLVCRNHFLVK